MRHEPSFRSSGVRGFQSPHSHPFPTINPARRSYGRTYNDAEPTRLGLGNTGSAYGGLSGLYRQVNQWKSEAPGDELLFWKNLSGLRKDSHASLITNLLLILHPPLLFLKHLSRRRQESDIIFSSRGESITATLQNKKMHLISTTRSTSRAPQSTRKHPVSKTVPRVAPAARFPFTSVRSPKYDSHGALSIVPPPARTLQLRLQREFCQPIRKRRSSSLPPQSNLQCLRQRAFRLM